MRQIPVESLIVRSFALGAAALLVIRVLVLALVITPQQGAGLVQVK
jgi:hypothetical protein